jgi:hypothetical protein
MANYNDIRARIQNSGLGDQVVAEALPLLDAQRDLLNKELDELLYSPPEANGENFIAELVISLIAPVLQKYACNPPKVRDLHRDLYQSLGGKTPVQYETK